MILFPFFSVKNVANYIGSSLHLLTAIRTYSIAFFPMRELTGATFSAMSTRNLPPTLPHVLTPGTPNIPPV